MSRHENRLTRHADGKYVCLAIAPMELGTLGQARVWDKEALPLLEFNRDVKGMGCVMASNTDEALHLPGDSGLHNIALYIYTNNLL